MHFYKKVIYNFKQQYFPTLQSAKSKITHTNTSDNSTTKMRPSSSLVVFAAVIVAVAGLFEDQAFKFDWRKSLVGIPVSARLLEICFASHSDKLI